MANSRVRPQPSALALVEMSVTNFAPRARILLVDEHLRMRRITCLLIELADEHLVVTSEAGSGEEAMTRWRDDRPDIVVLDHLLPDGNGLVLAAAILTEDPA